MNRQTFNKKITNNDKLFILFIWKESLELYNIVQLHIYFISKMLQKSFMKLQFFQ